MSQRMKAPSQPILGLDLAPVNRTGWAFLDRFGQRTYGVFALGCAYDEFPGERMVRLRDWLVSFLRDNPVCYIAYEDATFGSHNSSVQAMHNEVRGIVKMVAAEWKIPTLGINPMTLKKFATGNGRAPKVQMIRAAKTMLGVATNDDNVADALFIVEFARQNREVPLEKRVRKPRKKSPQRRLF